MSQDKRAREFWVPENHLFDSASECLDKFTDQAASLVCDFSVLEAAEARIKELEADLEVIRNYESSDIGKAHAKIRDLHSQLAEKDAEIANQKDFAAGNICGYCWDKMHTQGYPSQYEQLEQKNAKLVEALEFYADQAHWVARDGGGGLRVEGFDCEDNAMLWGFSGRRAREALKIDFSVGDL